MNETVKSGTLLIAEGSSLPTGLHYESESFVTGWGQVQNLDSRRLEQIIRRAGWTFFFIAGAIEMIALGTDQKKGAVKALKRIITSLKTKQFNCLEVTGVAAKRFMGLPYVKVSVHLRHIQPGLVLFAN